MLIVDDSPSLRRSLRKLLEKNIGWRVCGEAGTGDEAIAEARRLRPDLVVLDFSLPAMNGLETANLLKHEAPALPIVMLTGHKDKFLEQQAFKVGVSAVVSKEDNTRTLLDLARVLLKYGGSSQERESPHA